MAVDKWRCGACDTNNEGGATACRRCGRAAATTATAISVERPTKPRPAPEPTPDFGPPSSTPTSEGTPRRASRVRGTSAGSGRAAPRSIRRPTPPPTPPPVAVVPPPTEIDFPAVVDVTMTAVPGHRPAELSKTAPTRRPSPPRTRPRTVPPPPPPPPRLPSYSRSWRRRIGRTVIGWVLALAALGTLGAVLAHSGIGSTSASGANADSGATGAAQPCPTAVARWLPDGGSDSTVIGAYQTPTHLVTLCRDADGQAYYDGQVKNAPVNSSNHISLPAQPDSDGYLAVNGAYSYLVAHGDVTVSRNGATVSQTTLEPAG